MLVSFEYLLDPVSKFIRGRLTSNTERQIQNNFDLMSIYTKYLLNLKTSKTEVQKYLDNLANVLTSQNEQDYMKISSMKKMDKGSRQIDRLIAMVQGVFQQCIKKVKNSLLRQNQKIIQNFYYFRTQLVGVMQKYKYDSIHCISSVLNFLRYKYINQILKLQKYIQVGQEFNYQNMEKINQKFNNQFQKQIQVDKTNIMSCSELKKRQKFKQENLEISQKRSQVKKGSQIKKYNQLFKPKRNISSAGNKRKNQSLRKNISKQQNFINKFYKQYAIMQVNKKQFFENYIFEKYTQQTHKQRLLNYLIQKNKSNANQIESFSKKCQGKQFQTYTVSNPTTSNDFSTQFPRNQSSTSKISVKTNFIIKVKSSMNTRQSNTDISDIQQIKSGIPICRTSQNISHRNKIRSSTSGKTNLSKNSYIVKSPIRLEYQLIDKAPTIHNKCMQGSLAIRNHAKNNQNIRLKRRNNQQIDLTLSNPQSLTYKRYIS